MNGVGWAAALLSTAFISASALVAEVQLTVSPGHPSKLARIWSACPTFSWESVAGAKGYEFVVYRLQGQAGEVQEALRRGFEGQVDSWTPPLESCLERGGRYAWLVRATGLEGATAWSSPSFFEVVDGPSEGELRAALAVIRSHFQTREIASLSFDSVATNEADAPRAAVSGAADAKPRPRVAAETLLKIDGGLQALSFAGDGSTLTSLDPANISPGTAFISINGSSTGLDCIGCINKTFLGGESITSEDIGDGEVTTNRTDRSEVQARISTSCPDGAMRTISLEGEPTCTPLTGVLRGEEYLVSSFGGEGYRYVLVRQDNRLCFLVYVGMKGLMLDYEDAWCLIKEYIEPGTGTPFWLLEAFSEDATNAECGMRCVEFQSF